MAPFRNPFARRPGATATATDEKPHLDIIADAQQGFQRVDTVGSKASSSLSINSGRSGRSIDTGDYKMSVVNDSGVYLPPSPTLEKGLWPRQYDTGRISTDTKSSIGEIEPFSISRESFDSYRRSFDVSARSPVRHEAPARASLDISRLPHHGRRPFLSAETPTPEEFEDVGLDEKAPAVQPPRRRGFFSKFTTTSTTTHATAAEGQTGMSRWIGGGRKRAVSGASMGGSELKPIEQLTASAVELEDEREDGTKTPTPTRA